MTQEDIDSMLVNELKLELSKLGAPTSGKKVDLVERLKNLRTEPKMISRLKQIWLRKKNQDMLICSIK